MIKNYYEILAVDFKVSRDDIKKAYRKLVLKFHPDVNKSPDAHDIFIKINEAYLILSDEEARQQYDNEYIYYFVAANQINTKDRQQSEDFINPDLRKWASNAAEQAESYSKMSIDNFSRLVSDIAKETFFQISIVILGTIGAFSLVFGIYNLIVAIVKEQLNGLLFINLLAVIFGGALIKLAYKKEQNH